MTNQRTIKDEDLAKISGGGADELQLRSPRIRNLDLRQRERPVDPAPPESGGPGVSPEAEGENDGSGSTTPHLGM